MDRKNRRVTYLTGANATFNAYGMNDDQKKKKNKKKNTIQSRIRMAILIFALIGVLIVCVIYALTGSTREGVGRVTRIGATLSQNVSPFGDSVIFYDGTTLHCVAATSGAIRSAPTPTTTRPKSASSHGRATTCTSSTTGAASSTTTR